MLRLGKQGLAVHQLDDDFALPQRLFYEVVVLRFRHGQVQGVCHVAQSVHIVFRLAAKPAGQLIGVILVSRQVGSGYRHAADAAPVCFDGAGAVEYVAVLLQCVVREEGALLVDLLVDLFVVFLVVLLRLLPVFCLLRQGLLRFGFLGRLPGFFWLLDDFFCFFRLGRFLGNGFFLLCHFIGPGSQRNGLNKQGCCQQ